MLGINQNKKLAQLLIDHHLSDSGELLFSIDDPQDDPLSTDSDEPLAGLLKDLCSELNLDLDKRTDHKLIKCGGLAIPSSIICSVIDHALSILGKEYFGSTPNRPNTFYLISKI